MPKVKPITTRINEALRRMGRPQRFLRGAGYYYVSGVAVSSGLYWCWLDNSSESDYRGAVEHVEEVLTEDDRLSNREAPPVKLDLR